MHNVSPSLILTSEATLSDAIEKLDQSPFKTVFIVNADNILIGSLTDGDIRRFLLKTRTLDANISQVINISPVTARPSQSKSEIKNLLTQYGIKCVPVVDEQNHIIYIVNLDSLSSVKDLDNSVFILAGGFGKRLRPLTNSIPKPMLKFGEKPILQLIIEQFRSYGYSKFIISTHYKSDMIKSYFRDGNDLGVCIDYINEDKPLGTAGSLGFLSGKNIDQPLIVMNADLLVKIDFRSFLEFHLNSSADLTICGRHFLIKSHMV